ncbi:MAG TPA: TIGR02391 family protein [Baekduia sp.]|nr:TIGR02391 family protein [Baekduia sp.]
MLSFEVHRQLADLIASVNRLTTAAADRAPAEEIALLADVAEANATDLASATGAELGNLMRHIWWIRKNHRAGRPEASDGDIADLRERDLIVAIDAVTAWSATFLSSALVEAVEGSWRAEQYDAAVRDAFVHLERRMRDLAAVEPREGLTGRRLVNRLLPTNGGAGHLGDQGLLGHLTDGEQGGARDLLNGAVSLFRNASAHRQTAYSRAEAEDVIHLVNLCLRLMDKYRRPDNGADPSHATADGSSPSSPSSTS